MTKSSDVLRSPIAVVFGGRSPIAVACARHMSVSQDVVLVTRNIDYSLQQAFINYERVELLEANLEETGAGLRIIQFIYERGQEINAVVFLQRYRTNGLPNFSAHCSVELWSIQEVLEAICDRKDVNKTIQAWISSSPAAHKAILDQDLSYHIVKAGQEALVHFYAALLGKQGIAVNAIRIGSIVLKNRAMGYWNSIPHVTAGLQNAAPIGKLLTSDDIGLTFAKLALMDMDFFSGQILTIDNGFELRDCSQVAKDILERVE